MSAVADLGYHQTLVTLVHAVLLRGVQVGVSFYQFVDLSEPPSLRAARDVPLAGLHANERFRAVAERVEAAAHGLNTLRGGNLDAVGGLAEVDAVLLATADVVVDVNVGLLSRHTYIN